MNSINVLDHGYVRLLDSMGSDIDVVRAARISHDAAWRSGDADKRLINYLWKNKHSSPFEMVEFKFEIQAPIFVFRQWHRHRTWSYNEVSGRYTELPEVYFVPKLENIGSQSKKNKQGRINSFELSEESIELRNSEIEAYDAHCAAGFTLYRRLLGSGWPRELARGVLPLCTYSKMFAKVDLWNLLKFVSLRQDMEHAQLEIVPYAEAMVSLIEPIVPTCIEAFKSNNLS